MTLPPVVWLASYPRSGNTWVRFLLANLLAGPIAHSAEMEQHVPDLHWTVPEIDPGAPFVCIKTHHLPDVVADSPHLRGRPVVSAGIILLVRHPVPVMASDLRYFLERVRFDPAHSSREAQAEAFVSHWVANGGYHHWQQLGFGTWPQHGAAWRQQAARVPLMLLRYEDLKADPERETARLATFLGLDPARVPQAVAHSSFATLRRLEEAERAAGAASCFGRGEGRFVDRAGEGAVEQFAPETLRALWQTVGPVAEPLGYHCPV